MGTSSLSIRTLLLFTIPLCLVAGTASEMAQALRSVALDPAECYRIRELELKRGDVRFFLTDGYLVFSTPVDGAPVAAVFSADVPGGDGEVILLPPTAAERRMLNQRAGAPNIDEHLRDAAFFFADNTAAELKKQMEGKEWIHRDATFGAHLVQKYDSILRSLVPGFETHLLLDLLNTDRHQPAYFAALLGGRTLGGFDIVFDPSSPEQIFAGKTEASDKPESKPAVFNLWTSFIPASLNNKPVPDDFEVAQYRIDAHIDPKLHMRVSTELTAQGLTRDLNALSFDLSRQMKIVSTEVDGEPAETLEAVRSPSQPGISESDDQTDRLFLIVPSHPLRAGVPHQIKVIHEGDVIASGPNRVFFVGSRGRWYPHRPGQFSRFDLIFHFPNDLDLVAPGDAVRDAVEGAEHVIERRSDVPLAMAGFNLGSYVRTVVKRGDFTVEVCANKSGQVDPAMLDIVPVPGPQEADRGRLKALANDIGNVMDFYTKRLGPPPLRNLIVSPIPTRFGQGFAGLIYLSTMAYMNPSGKALSNMNPETRLFFTELMHAHEAAHQWWGNLVLTAGYHDEWIAEALSNYCALLYLEKVAGPQAKAALMSAYRAGLLTKADDGAEVDSAGPVTQGRRIELDGAPDAWISIVYGKGAWVMQMLHARLGDDGFWKMLAELRRRYEHKTVTTAQFRDLCAEFLPPGSPDRKLEAFFDQWVFSTGIPALRLTSSVKGTGPAMRLIGTLTQTDGPDDFSADYPLEFEVRGKKTAKWLRSSSEPVTFSIPVLAKPSRVELDPEGQFLKR